MQTALGVFKQPIVGISCLKTVQEARMTVPGRPLARCFKGMIFILLFPLKQPIAVPEHVRGELHLHSELAPELWKAFHVFYILIETRLIEP